MATTIKGYVYKDGKLKPVQKRKSVSAKIAEKKRPRRRYRPAGVTT